MSKKAEMRKDTSERVQQKDKIKAELKIREFKWTEKQQKFIQTALDKQSKVIICKAPSGVGKTLLSLFCCLKKLNEKKISQIVYYRSPIESCSKSVGFLKGSLDEKMEVYGLPLGDHLEELLDKNAISYLLNDERIIIDSVGFAKGRTFNVSGIIVDEAEDLSVQEILLLMTRMGKYSCLFLIGDIAQSNVRNSGFDAVFKTFNNPESKENGIHTFEFTKEDCLRSEIIKFILTKFEEIQEKKNK
jgi:phosphate starvation-inducible PhoH-like protein